MILATFNISKAKDKNGSEIEPDCTYLPGIVRFVIYVFYDCPI